MHNRSIRGRRPDRTPAVRLVPGLALLALAACEVPTSLPQWDTLWIAPGRSTAIAVGSLLPSHVSTTPAGDTFILDIPPVSFEESVGEACPACSAANGLVVPKPEFTLSASAVAPLPDDVVSARLEGGELQVRLQHDFGFDPLRPGAATRGYLLLVATSGSATLARDSISGNDVQWPAGTTLDRTLTLGAGDLTEGVAISATLYSPLGDPVRIDTSEKLTITATPTQLRVSETKVRLTDQTIDTQGVDLDLGDIDPVVVDHQKGGALLLDITNPFNLTGTLTVTITAPGAMITKPLTLGTGTTTARVALSEAELSSILGQSPVRLRATGTVSTPADGTTVKPSQTVEIASRLELTIGPKEAQ